MATAENISSSRIRLNSSGCSEEDFCLNDYDVVSSSLSSASLVIVEDKSSDQLFLEEEDDYWYYFSQFSYPDENDDDDLAYFYDDNNNDDLYVNNHLNREQLYLVDYLEQKNYQRTKRSNKKSKVQCQGKTKYPSSIKIKSHNNQLYIHHRFAKKIELNLPITLYIPSSQPLVERQTKLHLPMIHYIPPPRPFIDHQIKLHLPSNDYIPSPQPLVDRPYYSPSHSHKKNQQQTTCTNTRIATNRFREYTINESNVSNVSSFDDAMITFLLQMQNRDLSPNDYEMLLRLDERVQKKTVNTNILQSLPTINVNETHLNDQCTICMETYTLDQQLKLLPCSHLFHLNCIETYLKQFSTQCPLDNISLI